MKFNKKVLDNGLVVLHEERDVPVTTVMLGVRYGSAYETEEEKGMAHFIEHLCFKGTEKRSAREIAFEVERLGGDLNAFTHEEITAYHVKIPSNCLGTAMDVIFDIFYNPIFPEQEVKKEANVICEEIKMYRDNPRAHVLEKIKNNLYKPPFGMFIAGTQENVIRMSREILLKKHREIYVPKNSILSVVGKNSFEEVLEFAKKFIVEREGVLPILPRIESISNSNFEKRQDLQQANLALGFHFPFNSDKRYSAEIFCSILGEGMSSRLFTEVREKRGLVYGVKSELDIGKNYGYMIVWAGTDSEKTEEVKKICLEEIEKMKNISNEELEEGKKQVIGRYYVDSEESNSRAINLIMQEISGNAEEYYDYPKKINNVSLKDIQELAKIKDYASFVLS